MLYHIRESTQVPKDSAALLRYCVKHSKSCCTRIQSCSSERYLETSGAPVATTLACRCSTPCGHAASLRGHICTHRGWPGEQAIVRLEVRVDDSRLLHRMQNLQDPGLSVSHDNLHHIAIIIHTFPNMDTRTVLSGA